ncbi:hypothetical protein ACFE04_029349 [Oxalis oulophora]
MKPSTIFYLVVLLLLPLLVSSSKCISSCNEQQQQLDDQNEKPAEALKFKIVAIVVILVASAIGVSLPLLVSNISYLAPDTCIFFLIKAFAAGVILATGFIHVLPDAFESLNSPCLSETPWHKFPFAGLVAMLSAIGTLMMESFATGYHKRNELAKARPVNGDEEELGDLSGGHGGGHVHGSGIIEERSNGSDLIRHRIISQVLELGIVVHSVIIGLTLGASQSPTTVKFLVIALTCHQFFEGMGLGGCIFQAEFKKKGMIIIMVLFFSLTTPIGIGVGIGILKMYEENSPTALIVQGLLNAASAGILIYMALVDLLAPDFMNSKMLSNVRLQVGANFCLLLGACCMSLLATWGQ